MSETSGLLRKLHPEGALALEHMNLIARDAIDSELLELCRLRVLAMLGCPEPEPSVAPEPRWHIESSKLAELSQWDRSGRFSSAERAHLAITEQFVTSVRDVADGDVAALLEHRTPEDVHSFISALYVVEMTQRLEMALSAVMPA